MIFKKKKILTIDELNAYKIAYGSPLKRKELFFSLMIPFVVAFFYTFILQKSATFKQKIYFVL